MPPNLRYPSRLALRLAIGLPALALLLAVVYRLAAR